ncbi:hypothetical protein C7974DRAFT_449842 [Boeremia exigua]|uniref:uncharacterized protein n=1 Tax=Boeremia exigua TaxID=749465 RepID=UPI001E8DBDB3|nr:uncharacterized protein C7974DRAFT_449842 [Boeremia exigua]KAH6639700.1 hypothetical protein C7974DRAFT_449842 [Boeremia exigua]
MHIRTVDHALVAADCREVQHLQETLHPTSRSKRFNTAQHAHQDIVPVVPETDAFTHEQPPWTAYGYVMWQPLISRSQNMRESHVIRIPGSLYEDLMRCHTAWIATNRFPPELIEETIFMWQSTKRGRDLAKLLDGKKKWFVRLDQMSPKDSPFGGKQPSCTFEDVVVKLCSSMRAWNCLQSERSDAETQGRELKMELVLNPWDEHMDPGREFRVFVPPPATRGASAYNWPAPFAFDLALQHDRTVQLVELNPFGALSACGSCLFNWITDGRVLYGLEKNVEFAITLSAYDSQG